ncbi:kelch-like protein 41a [Nephila pilipes]|uniref:Kelch-like protein diablo n=1 Tax=Nephila pilipes TaxID=299642 RepID=A0A8X6UV16_NEPPI|nr:kelch-like protein 41a [Nephila pilipes]
MNVNMKPLVRDTESERCQAFSFKNIFKSGEFERLQKLSDAALHTESGDVFKVHRMFLAYRNSFFLALFCRNKTENHFYIPYVSAATLDTILTYLYTGNVNLTDENVKDLLVASSRLLVKDLFKICRAFAVKNINTRNCLSIFVAAWNIRELCLLKDCYRFVQIYFEEVLWESRKNVGDLPFEALVKLLGDKNLNVTSERVVWEAIVKWSEMNTPQRLCLVPKLLGLMYTGNIDENLATEILCHSMVKNNPFCSKFNETRFAASNRSILEKCVQENQLLMPDICRIRSPSSLNFISYYSLSRDSPLIKLYLTYDEQLDIWRQVGDIDFWPDSLLQIREFVYMFNSLENRGLAFDTVQNSFIQLSPSPFPRFHYHAVAMGDLIYVFGGATERDESMSLTECYDPQTDSWELMRPMVPMVLSEVAIIDKLIYAIGEDKTASVPTMMVQVYDPNADIWRYVAAPKAYRQEFAIAAFKGNLYVMGGHNIYECLRSVELYDPTCDAWKDLPDLPFAYVLPKAIVLEGKMIVYENLFKGRRYGTVYSPVYLNSDSNLWVVVTPDSPLTDIHLFQFCSLEDPDILKELVAKNRCSGTQWIRSSLDKSFKSLT